MSARASLQHRLLPRTIVALSQVRAPRRAAASVRRALGGRATVRLFVAFDDPYSAVAAVGLAERLEGRRAALRVEPVVGRGIPHDPAVAAKRSYALLDARRLAARDQHVLSRTVVIPPEDTAFLAAWTAALPHRRGSRTGFAVAAMRELWLRGDGPIPRERLAALWREHGGTDAPPGSHPRVARAERTARLRGLYDTPIALVHGQWFFAHERLDQIAERLDELGWRAAT